MPGVFEAYFCILDRITIKDFQNSFQEFVESFTVVGDPEIIRVDNTIRINDLTVMLGFGNVDTDIEHRKPPLMMEK